MTAKNPTPNDMSQVNAERLKNVDRACRELGYRETANSTSIRAHITTDLNVLYCRVNKCGSTMCLEVLRRLFDCDTDCLLKTAEQVKQNPSTAREIMEQAYSFLVVREPFGRLLSTYANIFYFPKQDWSYRSTGIIKLVRENPSAMSLQYGYDLTFAELVKYTVDGYEQGQAIDEHVRPMSHRSCNPCMFQFNYIAKLETLKSDFEYLMSLWKAQGLIDDYGDDLLADLREWTIFGPVKRLYWTIPKLKGANITLYDLFLRAWSYYQLTGQISKHIDLPYEPDDVETLKQEDFIEALSDAVNKSKEESGESLRQQRMEALKQAYSKVPTEYLEKLAKVYREDCELFGYDPKPSFLFQDDLSHYSRDGFDYFKGI